MSVVRWLDGYQRRRRWAGFPLAVVYKYADDQGNYLAALLAFYGFVSLFPLLLLLTTALGFALDGDPDLQQRILGSALGQFPIVGDQLRDNVDPLRGSAPALVFGALGALYGSLGIVQAGQSAMNKVWAVPRNARPNPIAARLRSLVLLIVLGGGLLVTTVLAALTTSAAEVGVEIPGPARVLPAAVAVVVNLGLFLIFFRALTARVLSIREVLPGAAVAAVGWQVLQTVGTYLLSTLLQGSSQTYGLFGLVLGLLSFLYLGAVLVVLAAEVNAVRVARLWPRALLTPFTDDVDLTRGDQRAYTSYPETERFKDDERINVDFPDRPHGR